MDGTFNVLVKELLSLLRLTLRASPDGSDASFSSESSPPPVNNGSSDRAENAGAITFSLNHLPAADAVIRYTARPSMSSTVMVRIPFRLLRLRLLANSISKLSPR